MLSDTRAKMNITIRYSPDGSSALCRYCVETVEFTKTADGWRVSGGTVFDVIRGERNPNTSDSTVPAIAILGTIAVVSLALPIVIYKKRRRVA